MQHGELSIPVRLHHSGLWVAIALQMSHQVELLMVLDSGSPVSAISPAVRDDLHTRGLLRLTATPRYYRLAQLQAADAPDAMLPDVDVRVLPRLTLLGIDGLLGLDFFRQFERMCFHVSASRLVLEYPPTGV